MAVLPEAGTISVARGVPSPDMFPLRELAEAAQRAINEDGGVALNYGAPRGYGPMLELLAGRHHCHPDHVVLTPGSLIALNFVFEAVRSLNARVIVESPTYDRVLRSLRNLGLDISWIHRTNENIDLDKLRSIVSHDDRPSLFYILPTFHNPTGTSLAEPVRHELVGLADECDLYVLEDDPYGLLRVEGESPASLYALLSARGRRDLALFASSFSKTVAPGLRVGYLLLPDAFLGEVEALAAKTYLSPPLFPQAQLFEFLKVGDFEPHLELLRAKLRARRDALLAVLEDGMPVGTRWTRPEGGYFLWLEFPDGLDADLVSAHARTAGVPFVPGSAFFPFDSRHSGARLSFSYPSVDEISAGGRRLALLVTKLLATATD